MKNSLVMLAAASVMVLVACGGGGGGETPVQSTESSTGSIRIAITDAAVDDVFEVNVQFTGVTLKPESGDEIVITFDTPRDFDLLALTGGLTAELLSDTTVPAGTYNWVRLAVNAEFDDIYDSYAVLPTGMVELRVPSGSQNGLKLVSGFTVVADGATNVVIDWDLRKALSDPRGQPGLHLRPALRITDMSEYGTLSGMVASDLVNDVDTCTNDPALNIGSAVYLYQGAIDTPGDIGDAVNDPFVTATVLQIGDEYLYEVNFLPVGDYTAAFTCQASDDDVELDDDIAFSAPQILTIIDGSVTEVNF